MYMYPSLSFPFLPSALQLGQCPFRACSDSRDFFHFVRLSVRQHVPDNHQQLARQRHPGLQWPTPRRQSPVERPELVVLARRLAGRLGQRPADVVVTIRRGTERDTSRISSLHDRQARLRV